MSPELIIKQQKERMRAGYHKLSIEHEIPLDIAEAVMHSGIFTLTCVSEATFQGMWRKSRLGISSWGRTWDLIGKHLGWSQVKVDSILVSATEAIAPIIAAAITQSTEEEEQEK